jgi:hypothetical protein
MERELGSGLLLLEIYAVFFFLSNLSGLSIAIVGSGS